MEKLREGGSERAFDSPEHWTGNLTRVSEEGACSDAAENAGKGRRWSIILIFALVPLVLLVTVLLGGFVLVSIAFGAEQTELLAAHSDTDHLQF
ncbi:hypothetical protein [Pararhizobium antarcticum]|nr:hypothetical protein [Pararhizobium antarcticum]